MVDCSGKNSHFCWVNREQYICKLVSHVAAGRRIYSGTMPLGIVHLGGLAVTPRGRDGVQNT